MSIIVDSGERPPAKKNNLKVGTWSVFKPKVRAKGLVKADKRKTCTAEGCKKPGLPVEKLENKVYCAEHVIAPLIDVYFPKCAGDHDCRLVVGGDFPIELKAFVEDIELVPGYETYRGKTGETVFTEDYNYSFKDEPICDSCRSDDTCDAPECTVKFSDGRVLSIYQYTMILEDGRENVSELDSSEASEYSDWIPSWHSSNAWRGYYEVHPSEWVQVHEDCILSGSDDSEELETFDSILTAACERHEIEWARVVSRTSNLFSAGYDFYVKKEHLKKFNELILPAYKKLTEQFRDYERFTTTALTGEYKGKSDKNDQFLIAYNLIQNGATAKEAIEKISELENLK